MIPIFLPASKHKFCHLCGSRLLMQYTEYSTGLVVCPACERTAPRCTACTQPAKHLTPVDHDWLCNQCMNALPRCTACNKPIMGHYFRFSDSPKPYCPACSSQRPTCQVCGAPLGPDGQQLPGNLNRCGECAQTMVLDDAVAQSLYQMVIQQTKTFFEKDVQQVPMLRIVGPAELAAVRQKYEPTAPSSGLPAQHVLGYFEQWGHTRSIYVERALPRATLIGTLAHEYAHAWQADYAPNKQDLQRREGFAEWLSWSVLVALGHTREAARATRREDEYGQGLRHFIALEKRAGRQAIFSEATRAT
jgi:hypothetical protein